MSKILSLVSGVPRMTTLVYTTSVVVNTATTFSLSATVNDVLLCDATSGAQTITLPTAVGNSGKPFNIMKTDSSANSVTINTTSSQTIDGVTSKVISTQYQGFSMVSDGSNWNLT
jgi:hypothetical protein